MAFPYVDLFLGLLAVYLVYSVWAGLDGRYPVAAALVLLVATAGVDATGATATANILAEFSFFLLVGGVVLLLIEHVRSERRARTGRRSASVPEAVPGGEATEATHEGDRPPEHSLDDLEQEPVPPVDASGQGHEENEHGGERHPDEGETH